MQTAKPIEQRETPVTRPDFVVIGAAKAGTSSLFGYLCRHAEVCGSSIKEPEVFTEPRPADDCARRYAELFAAAKPDQVCGEASTSYSRFPQVPGVAERMLAFAPKVRLIYMMRHPVDRAYSQYVHRVRKELYPGQPIPVTFEDHIETDPLCLDSSDYMLQIEQYRARFGDAALLPLLADDLNRDPASVLRRAFEFLGVDADHDVLTSGEERANRSDTFTDTLTAVTKARRIKRLPGFSLVRRITPPIVRQTAYHMLARMPGGKVRRSFTPTPMKSETRAALIERFREPNERLAAYLDVDLSHWNE